MAAAKEKLLKYFMEHIGEDISRDKLKEVSGNISDWPRALRQLRQETGYDIKATKDGYIMETDISTLEKRQRGGINNKLKYAVLQRDNSTCQRCGANIHNTINVKLVIDHKIPVELGGETMIDNLWTLCSVCNGGKQAFFDDTNTVEMQNIMKLNSASKRLMAYFQLHPNRVIEPIELQSIANARDWERALRKTRQEGQSDIEWIRPNQENRMGGYKYKPNNVKEEEN